MNIKFSPPDIQQGEIDEVVAALQSGWITTGPRTKELERRIAAFCNTKRAICLNSATACMELCLRALGVGEGDEVITTAYTYTATASVIHHVGATIVMVDTKADSTEMDYDKLAKAITDKTKVIMPVDIAGIMCDYDKIFEIVESKKDLFTPSNEIQKGFGRIVVLADAAHSLGATKDGKKCGEVADFTSFSLHAVKNLTTAEGGALTWKEHEAFDSEEFYKTINLYSLHGQSKDALAKTQLGAWEYDIVAPLYKCNMTDVAAAIGLAQLTRYESMLAKRKEIIEKYDEALKDMPVTVLKHYSDNHSSSGHLYLVRLNGKNRQECNAFIERMAAAGIPLNVHYKPLPLLSAYKNLGFDINDYPNAFAFFNNEVTLPLHTCLTDEEVEYIIDNFKKLF